MSDYIPGCDIVTNFSLSYLFSKEFFAVKPLKHIGLSDITDMEELIHMKIHELGTKGYFKLLAE